MTAPPVASAPEANTSESTPVGPTWRERLRSYRFPLVATAVVVVVGLLIAWYSTQRSGDPFDPRSAAPEGTRALAVLLDERGVDVQRVSGLDSAQRAAASEPGSTLVVARPDLIAPTRFGELAAVLGDGIDHLVVFAPDEPALTQLGAGDTVVPAGRTVPRVRAASCAVPAAQRAGEIRTDGQMYRPLDGPGETSGCYGDGNRAALVRWAHNGVTVDILGASATVTNAQLADEGHAALAMNLLGANERVVWHLPTPADLPQPDEPRPVFELLPAGAVFGAVQLGVAAIVLMLARARRLGPVVPEPLPVVVRASEAVEGRARLYRRSRARDRAAGGLRDAAAERLRVALGLGPASAPEALTAAVAGRTGRPAAEVHDLLFGAVPADDAALVRLADELDQLEFACARVGQPGAEGGMKESVE